jgi:hypothetical protein
MLQLLAIITRALFPALLPLYWPVFTLGTISVVSFVCRALKLASRHVCSLSVDILICTVEVPLWSSGQSSWLQIQRSEFDSRRYQIFTEVVGLQRGPLSLVSTIEELLERKSNGSGQPWGSFALTTRHLLSITSWH